MRGGNCLRHNTKMYVCLAPSCGMKLLTPNMRHGVYHTAQQQNLSDFTLLYETCACVCVLWSPEITVRWQLTSKTTHVTDTAEKRSIKAEKEVEVHRSRSHTTTCGAHKPRILFGVIISVQPHELSMTQHVVTASRNYVPHNKQELRIHVTVIPVTWDRDD